MVEIICKKCNQFGLKYAKGLCTDCYKRKCDHKNYSKPERKEYLKNYRIGAALVIGLLPLIRHEGIALCCLFSIYMFASRVRPP